MEKYPPYKFKVGPPKHLVTANLVEGRDVFKDGPVLVRLKKLENWDVDFLIKDGKKVLSDSAADYTWPMEVYWVDLDNNGFKDFVVISWNMGSGLASHEYTVDIFLKEKEGVYHKISYISMDAGLEDFVGPGQDEKYNVIINDFYGGSDHNYFTYDIYEFKDYHLVNADSKHKGFPKFVWLTYKKNDRDAVGLTQAERQSHVKEKDGSITYSLVP